MQSELRGALQAKSCASTSTLAGLRKAESTRSADPGRQTAAQRVDSFGAGPALAVHGPHRSPARFLASDCIESMKATTQHDGDVPPRAHAMRTAATHSSRSTIPGLHRSPCSSPRPPNPDWRCLAQDRGEWCQSSASVSARQMYVLSKRDIPCSPVRGGRENDGSTIVD